jgi:hypothetical protein
MPSIKVLSGAGDNYNINFAGAQFTITKATLTVNVDAGQGKVYGSSDPLFTYSLTGFKNGDDASILSGTLVRATGENVGGYAINQGTLGAGDNYNINFTGAEFTIAKATLTVTVDAGQGKVYGSSDPYSPTHPRALKTETMHPSFPEHWSGQQVRMWAVMPSIKVL